MRSPILSTVAAAAALLAASEAQARSYLLVAKGSLPAALAQSVTAAGGSVTRTIPQLGVAVVESGSAQFTAKAGKIAGIGSVLPNVQWKTTQPQSVNAAGVGPLPNSHTTLTDDSLAFLQWGLDAIDVADAWTLGQRGAGVRVAVLDSGIDADHPDIAPNLNLGLSTSFVPLEGFDIDPGEYFNHGTHVAGIIAAADQNDPLFGGTVGVAPEAEIVAVKVLSEYTGSGSFDGILFGIVYAALIDADIINMSLGAEFPRSGFIDDNGTPGDPSDDVKVSANEISALVTLLGKATTFAYQQGTTVIASAGNSGIDRNHDANLWVVPADCQHVISVSATGPLGWALDQSTDLDVPAFYTNYGQSRINFAAPGGNVDFSLYPSGPWFYDLVLSTSSESYFFAAGTSMAAPHVAGVAAIIIGKNGGPMAPAQVEAALRASADDLGKPGKDAFYGSGRVNAGNAAQ